LRQPGGWGALTSFVQSGRTILVGVGSTGLTRSDNVGSARKRTRRWATQTASSGSGAEARGLQPITREKRDPLMLGVREYFQDAKGKGTWHFPVAHLNVAAEWAMAGVTFRPKGWLARHVAESVSPLPDDLLAEAAARLDCATVDVHAESLEAARTQARDAVSLLRYYQRFLEPYMATQVARFGLTDEVFVNENLYVRERDDEGYLFGVGVAGRPGPFEFGVGYVTDFNYEPGLTVLAGSLAAASPTDWQRRFRTCLRFLGHAALVDEQQLRIVLLAAGIEVLLADGSMARPPQGTPKGTTADEVARRCAYVACGTSGAVGDKPGAVGVSPRRSSLSLAGA